MKRFFLAFFLSGFFFLQSGCSWICRFFIANPGIEPVTIDMKLSTGQMNFPIFHYPHHYYGKLRLYKLNKNNTVNHEVSKEVKTDTLENYSHYKLKLPSGTALEIGALQNDNYSRYDQPFINGRKFNLEKLKIPEKKIEVIPLTFDSHFRKGKYGDVYLVI